MYWRRLAGSRKSNSSDRSQSIPSRTISYESSARASPIRVPFDRGFPEVPSLGRRHRRSYARAARNQRGPRVRSHRSDPQAHAPWHTRAPGVAYHSGEARAVIASVARQLAKHPTPVVRLGDIYASFPAKPGVVLHDIAVSTSCALADETARSHSSSGLRPDGRRHEILAEAGTVLPS